ncbi:inner-membrane translocator [Candidatus Vecturithrix granuli]|uniref:Inner-membrane translocator n=1 Tax=Vecturithrix granuli TaxID=1499967 RepID=A0A081C2Z8_VECG1|nr:inner-membrane translocator [Candidatus Vecturithrix granuli]
MKLESEGKKENSAEKLVAYLKKKNLMVAEGTLILILVVLFVVLMIATDRFLTVQNLSNLVRQTSIIGIVALGMTFVIISAGIDLSVGAVVGLSSIVVALFLKTGMGIVLSVLLALVVGALVGLINGIIVYNGQVTPFIATLGMMTIVRGLIMLVSGAKMVAGLPKSFTGFAQLTIVGLPALFFVWLIVIILATIITKRTQFGRNVYAIGSNVEASRLSGIHIRNNIYQIYGISAFLSSVAGILLTARLGNGIPTAGSGYELDAIASAVVGGASLFGGEGSILGTVLGAILMATLRNGGNLLGINPFILEIAVGALIIFAVLVDQYNKRKK